MIKRLFFSALLLTLTCPLIGFAIPLYAQQAEQEVNVYFFWGTGCPHCEKQKPFLESLENRYTSVTVHDFNVWSNSETRNLFMQAGKALNADVGGVPFTVVGDQYVVGFLSEQTTGRTIENAVLDCLYGDCPDIVGGILNPEQTVATPTASEEEPSVARETGETAANNETNEPVDAPSFAINMHVFYADGCPLCTEGKKSLAQIAEEDPDVNVWFYDIGADVNARRLYGQALEEFDVKASSLPLIAIGQQYFMGWNTDGTTAAAITDALRCVKEERCPDQLQRFLYSSVSSGYEQRKSIMPEMITLPFIGDILTRDLSLPAFTIIVAALDGFNPCAMWTLIFLIGLLLGMEDKKRMWILGTAFIMASAAVYFLFLSAWLNLLLFIGFIFWVRLAIGFVALSGGGYYLKEFFMNPNGGCKVTGGEKRQRVFARMKEITQNSHFLLALGGIIILAVAVNLVELICSAGLPAVYTQVLTLSDLQMWQYYLYLLLYIFIFMLDDLFVFFSAMITLQMTGLSDKYARISHLIGGTLMVLIGLLLIFKPELLMFG